MTPSEIVDIVLLVILAVTGIAVIRTRNLFAAVMLASIYSLVSAGLFTVMDAVDVAFTEAAVGAGISTVLLLGTLALVGEKEHKPQHAALLPMVVVVITGGILIYGTSQMPPFGGADNPANLHVAPHYLEESEHEIHIPNVVTSVLASYRGYDTMGEVAVVFTAMVGVLLLLARGPLPRRVYRDGEWITVRPGTTREELEAEVGSATGSETDGPRGTADGAGGTADGAGGTADGAGDSEEPTGGPGHADPGGAHG